MNCTGRLQPVWQTRALCGPSYHLEPDTGPLGIHALSGLGTAGPESAEAAFTLVQCGLCLAEEFFAHLRPRLGIVITTHSDQAKLNRCLNMKLRSS